MSGTGSARLATNRSRTPLALFRDLPVLGKLLALVGVVCALVLTVGVVGVAQLGNSQNRLKVMYRDSLEAILWLGDVSTDVQSMRFQVTNLALVGAPGADQTAHDVAALDKNIDANWTAYTATDMRGRESNRDVFAAALATYRQVRDNELIPLAKQNKVAEYIAVRKAKILPTATTMQTALANLTSIEQKDAQSSLAEASAAYNAARTLILALIAVAVALAGILSAAIGRMISRPLHRTVTVLEAMAEGRLDQRVGITGRDEVGRMAGALDTAMDRLGGVLRDVDGNVAMLASSSEELSTVAAQMSGSAERSARQARSASEAAEQVNHNISTVASGAEELGASISEIARSASDAAGVAGQAVRISEDAGQILAKLGQSSNEIAAVVKLITTIAEQTNLLALNATIEAARAGDAGKGFAVVAGEVKELAQETAKATEDITARVSAIQADSAQAVSAISQINEVIQQINNTQSVIAAAVEEQSATTSEMSRGVGEVATGAQDISATLAEAAQIAVETTGAAGNTAQASTELARIATGLRQALSTMTY